MSVCIHVLHIYIYMYISAHVCVYFHMPKQQCPWLEPAVTNSGCVLAMSWSGNAQTTARPDLNHAPDVCVHV